MWQKLDDDILELHARFDETIREWSDGYASRERRIFCGKGCAACCTLAVNAVFPEARIIAGELPEARAGKVRAHALRLLDKSRDIPDLLSFLRMYRSTMGPCPLLDEEGICSIYGIRPLSCRSLLATRESRYCALDFGNMSREEKMAFILGLDAAEVSFPMHYVAFPQDRGRELESGAARSMADSIGFSLYGNLPFLIWLGIEHSLSTLALEGYEAVVRLLEKERLDNPYLVTLAQYDPSNGTP
jgi:Fe-S-cluster containining protein